MLTSAHTVCFRTDPREPASIHAKNRGGSKCGSHLVGRIFSHFISCDTYGTYFDPGQTASSAMHVPFILRGQWPATLKEAIAKRAMTISSGRTSGKEDALDTDSRKAPVSSS